MSVSVPQIVASQAFNSQSAAIPATTIYTPDADNLFKFEYYISSRVSGTASLSPKLLYTDDGFAEVVEFPAFGSFNPYGNANCSGGSFTFRAKSGDPIQVETVLFGGSTPTYDLYITLVAL